MREKPYPWKCRQCLKQTLSPATVDYEDDLDHDGRSYHVWVLSLEVLRCSECGNCVVDEDGHRRISSALRNAAGFLSPEEIKVRREAMNLCQEKLDNYIRVSKFTVSRWESGAQIQQPAMDTLLRLFFEIPECRRRLGFREALEDPVQAGDAATWQSVVVWLGPASPRQMIHEGDFVSAGSEVS